MRVSVGVKWNSRGVVLGLVIAKERDAEGMFLLRVMVRVHKVSVG